MPFPLTHSHTTAHTCTQVYVTHRLHEHGPAVWAALSAGGLVYVCGSAQKLPEGVNRALEDVVVEFGGLSREEAGVWVRRLELTGRYRVEAWS